MSLDARIPLSLGKTEPHHQTFITWSKSKSMFEESLLTLKNFEFEIDFSTISQGHISIFPESQQKNKRLSKRKCYEDSLIQPFLSPEEHWCPSGNSELAFSFLFFYSCKNIECSKNKEQVDNLWLISVPKAKTRSSTPFQFSESPVSLIPHPANKG